MKRMRIAAGVGLTLAGAALAGGSALSASAASSSSVPGVTAQVQVNSMISLTGVSSGFTLAGNPSTTATTLSAVLMNVKTNSRTGYNVTVQPGSAAMVGAVVGNTDTIPITDLTTRETGAATYNALTLTPLTVHSQATRSGAGGDALSEDFQMVVPFVSADTYTATLNYTANTQ